jgi:NAD(P)H-nitrite reductase large subunit
MRVRSPCHPVIGDEPRLTYNRVLLSSVLAGETALGDIELKPMSCGAIGALP